MSIVEFLLARIAEDEARARGDFPFVTWASADDDGDYDWDAPEPSGESWHTRRCGYGIGEMGLPCECGVPARVLAESAAKRRVVEIAAVLDYYGEDLLELLALPYADHPAYQEEWAP